MGYFTRLETQGTTAGKLSQGTAHPNDCGMPFLPRNAEAELLRQSSREAHCVAQLLIVNRRFFGINSSGAHKVYVPLSLYLRRHLLPYGLQLRLLAIPRYHS